MVRNGAADMARGANITAAVSEPEIAGSILRLPTNQIEMGERLRPVDDIWADALGRMISSDGQKTPVEVCRLAGSKVWRLVTGGHRLRGAQLHGLPDLLAVEVDNDRIERKLREIGENMWRRDLDPLDRATFVGEMHDLLRAKAGITSDQSAQSIAGQARWQKAVAAEADDASAIIADAYGFDAQIGERLGLSARSIRNDLTLRRRLGQADMDILRQSDHPVLRNGAQLRALASLDADERAAAIQLIVTGEAKAVAEAVATIRSRPKPNPRDKRINAFLRSFSAMPPDDKRAALTRLASELGRKQADHLIGELKKAGWQ